MAQLQKKKQQYRAAKQYQVHAYISFTVEKQHFFL